HGAGAGVVETEHEARERRLARARAAQQAEPSARSELEADASQGELVRLRVEVVEVDVLERHGERPWRERLPTPRRQGGARPEQLADALDAGGGLLQLLELLRDLLDR